MKVAVILVLLGVIAMCCASSEIEKREGAMEHIIMAIAESKFKNSVKDIKDLFKGGFSFSTIQKIATKIDSIMGDDFSVSSCKQKTVITIIKSFIPDGKATKISDKIFTGVCTIAAIFKQYVLPLIRNW